MENKEKIVREMWDTIPKYDLHVVAVPGKEERMRQIRFEEIIDNVSFIVIAERY